MHPTTTRLRGAAGALVTAGVLLGTVACAAAPTGATPAAEAAPAAVAAEPGAPGPAALTPTDVGAWLDGVLPTALEEHGIAGAAVSVVHDGEVVAARGYGWADTGADGGEPVPVDPQDTLFRVGSVSKLATATAVLQLVEQGRVDLDTDVEEYVDVDLRRRFDAPITLRHLLTHTAGFEERVRGLIGPPGTPVDLRAAMADDPPEQLYAPGTVPAYSNYGNALAGYVVEQVSGQPFEEYVQEHVLDRAGMTSSTFAQPLPDRLEPRMARGYADSSSAAAPFEVVGTAPAGALTASTTDMAAFALALLGEPVTGTPLLEPATLALMQEPALDGDDLGALAAGQRMTLGFFDESRNGHRVLGHGGDTNWFHSHLQVYPDDRTGIVVSLNSSGTGPTSSLDVRDTLVRQFADRYFPEDGADGPTGVDEATAREHAAAVTGRYASSRALSSTFLSVVGLAGTTTLTALEDGRLHVDPHPGTGKPAVLTEVEPWVWREVGGGRTLAARLSASGEVEAVGAESAFALLPLTTTQRLGVPVLVGAVAVMVLTVLGWLVVGPVRLVRRLRGRDGTSSKARGSRADRAVTGLTAAGTVAAVVAVAGWAAAVTTVMGLQEVPAGVLRGLQGLLVVGLLALAPAAVRLVQRARRRAGALAVTRSAGLVLALAALTWFAVEFRLLAPDLSY
ncbi:hypothetical protein GCM10028777_03070 [Angustibacter speluncae]